MDAEQLARLGLAIALTLIGGAALWWLWRCWTGRSRGWAVDGMTEPVVRGFGLPAALLLFGAGLASLLPEPVGPVVGAPLMVAGVVLVGPGLLIGFLPRRWWGPRWYRHMSDLDRQRLLDDRALAMERLAARIRGRSARLARPLDRHNQLTYETAEPAVPPHGAAHGRRARLRERGNRPTVVGTPTDRGAGTVIGGAVGARLGGALAPGAADQLGQVAAYLVKDASDRAERWRGDDARGDDARGDGRPGPGAPGPKEGSW